MSSDLSFPIGRFERSATITPEMRESAIDAIHHLPRDMRAAVAGLGPAHFDTPYRPNGWTVRQLVHHVADSHMNGYLRLKLALTEDNPTIKAYDQVTTAALDDSRLPPIVSLNLLDALHQRWTAVLKAVTPDQFSRPFFHPEVGALTIDMHVQMYAWHSRHHVAHITAMRKRLGI